MASSSISTERPLAKADPRPPFARTAVLGNMNNNAFALVRYLRDAGVDADLLMFNTEFDHFTPSADTYDLEYQRYCRTLPWGSLLDLGATPIDRILTDLAPYHFLIGCGAAPAYCERASRALDVFVPYGEDIWGLAMFRFVNPVRLTKFWRGVYLQQRGIARAAVCHMERIPMHEGRLHRLRPHGARWEIGIPMVYAPIYAPDRMAEFANRTHWWHEFDRVRAQHDLVLFSHVRHIWKRSETDINHKGTDKLLQGLAIFARRRRDIRVALVTIEYGPDVDHSKALAKALGIESRVFWFPRMLRRDLMVGINAADVICAEFTHSSLGYGVVHEAQVAHRPVLMYRDDSFYERTYSELYPVMNANSADDIAQRLEEYTNDPSRHRAMGAAGAAWYQRYVVDAALERYLAAIASAPQAAR